MYILVFFFFIIGIYFVFQNIFQLPSCQSKKKAKTIGKNNISYIDSLVKNTTYRLSKKIKISDEKREKIEHELKEANINIGVSEYLIRPYIYALLILLTGLPLIVLSPFLYILVIATAYIIYKKDSTKATEILKKKNEEIENALPRFVTTVAKEIQSGKSIYYIINDYIKTSNGLLKQELILVSNSIKYSGNIDSLIKFSRKYNNTYLNNLVQGLISYNNGNNVDSYLNNLAFECKANYKQTLKYKAMKIPSKIDKYNFIIFVYFVVLFLTPLVLELVNSFKGFL